MDNGKNPLGVFYLDGEKAFFYQKGLKSLKTLSFSPNTFTVGEIINAELFIEAIQTFLHQINIKPTDILVILSTRMTFDSDFPEQITLNTDEEMKRFLELVPFEESISKLFKLQKKSKVIAANKELSDNMKIAFEKLGFKITGIIPYSILREIYPDLASNISLEKITERIDAIKKYNILHADIIINENVETKEKNNNKGRLLLLIGVFGVLFIVLIFTIINSANS